MRAVLRALWSRWVARDVTWTLDLQLAEQDGRVEFGMGGAVRHDRGGAVRQAVAAATLPRTG